MNNLFVLGQISYYFWMNRKANEKNRLVCLSFNPNYENIIFGIDFSDTLIIFANPPYEHIVLIEGLN